MPAAARWFPFRAAAQLVPAAALLVSAATLAAQRPGRAPAPAPRPPAAAAAVAVADSARWLRLGVVTDSAGAPVADATVTEVKTGAVQATDSAGRFRLRGARVGRVSLEIRKPGFETMSFDFDAEPGDTTTLQVPLLAVNEPPPLPFARLPQSLAGRVIDPSGRPLEDATVQVITALKEVRTDTLGRFALAALPTGRHLVRARRVGYVAESFFATITDSTSSRLTIQLTPMGQDLGTVQVRARAGSRRLEQFENRKRIYGGFASFLTEADWRTRSPVFITDVLRTTRGVTVTTNSSGRQVLVGRGQCLMSVVLDGMPVPVGDEGVDSFVMPQDVAAIEVYPGDAVVPMEFRTGRSACGTVAIWTK